MFDEILENPTNNSRVVYYFRHFSFGTDYTALTWKRHYATEAAYQMNLASDPGEVPTSFWQMHDLIFGSFPPSTEENLFTFADSIGLDAGQFKTIFELPSTHADVQDDKIEAQALGVLGTPAVFVDGRRVRPWYFVPDVVECALLETDI